MDFELQIDAYARALEDWNNKHRIIGKTQARQLIQESLAALGSLNSQEPQCLVDIGAGGGLLGFPFLWLSPANKAIFVEPDKKKVAFIHYFASLSQSNYISRILVVNDNFEKVSRETIDSFSGPKRIFACRAFSGSKPLERVLAESAFHNEKFFVFSMDEGLATLKTSAKTST